jgi:VCBS repeat-containing protein
MRQSFDRKRRSFNIESLEPRLVLAAPVGIPENYTIQEDQGLSTLPTLIDANFDNPNTVVTSGSPWSYLDRIQNSLGLNQSYPVDVQSRVWNAPAFDVASSTIGPWATGNTPLQAGGIDAFPGAPNVLDGIDDAPGGADNLINTYLFRKTFDLTAAQAANTTGSLRLLCDDGCVIYVNGTEVSRVNMPAGAVATATYAAAATNETVYTTTAVTFPANLLQTGTNTIAVELHQSDDGSSDVGFDLELTVGSATNTAGFSYADDTFGTNRANNASGDYQATGGFSGGGLHVRLGDNNTQGNAVSGGWRQTFNMPAAASVAVSLRYRMIFSSEYENTESSEAVLTIDGTRYGTVNSAGTGLSLARFTGNGNNGSNNDTGWQTATFNVPLTVGNHTITVGGWNSSGSQTDEWTDVFFDDVLVGSGGTLPGVLANDTDADGDTLTAQKVSDPAHGVLVLNADGTFVYTPAANYNGADSFVYRPFDGASFGADTTVSFTIQAVNDLPVAIGESYTATSGSPLIIPSATGVLANDTDVDNPTLTAQLVTNPASGTLVLNADGSFTYTSNVAFAGSDSFTYRANDGTANGNTVTVNLTVLAVNQPPVAVDDAYQTLESTPLVITRSGAIPPQQVFFTDFNTAIPSQFSTATGGTREAVQGFGGLGVDTNTFTGSFMRNASDNGNGSGNATPTVLTLTGLPTHTSIDLNFLLAVIDSWDGNSGNNNIAPDTLNILVDGASIFSETFDTANSTDQSYSAPDGVTLADGEALGFATGGSSPDSAYNMGLDPAFNKIPHTASTLTIQWVASGNGWRRGFTGNESFALDNVEVIVNNDETNDTTLIPAGATWRYLDNGTNQGTSWRAPAFNDTAWPQGAAQLGYGDGDETTVVGFGGDENAKYATTYFRRIFNVTNASDLAALRLELLRDDGAAVYLNGVEIARDNLAPDAAYNTFAFGSIPSFDESRFFTFDVDPRLLVEGTNTIAVEVHQSDGGSTDLSFNLRLIGTQSNALGVLANDTDPENTALSASIIDNVDHGALTLNANGTFTYTPTLNYHGPDSFSYRASDGLLNSNVATVSITVVPGPNEPAVAVDDAYNLTEDMSLVIGVANGLLANDTDAENDPLQAFTHNEPAHGSLALNLDGSFTYTPNANYFGTDSFEYFVDDGTDNSNVAIVTLTIAPVNDIPAAVADHYFAEPDQTTSVNVADGVLSNDQNPDLTPFTAALVANVSHGLLTLNPNGSFDYAPTAGFTGADSFTYRANDGTDDSNTVTVTLTVDHSPVANPNDYTIEEEGTLVVSVGDGVLINDSDADLDPMTAVIASPPANGLLSLGNNGSLTYTPNVNFNGPDTFTYRASDGDQFSNPVTVTIHVTPVNDAPVAFDDSYSLFSNGTLNIAAPGVLANDVDIDSPTMTTTLVTPTVHGSLTLNPDGSFLYTPEANYEGPDLFSYRATDGSLFSAERTVNITVNSASQLIKINEIMYHPSSEIDAQEWIEIFNTGATPVSLAGWQFTNGVSYTFPAGAQTLLGGQQYLIVAADVATFMAQHPGYSGAVIGGWTGTLSNSGESLELSDQDGDRVDRVQYSDEGDWAARVAGPLDNGSTGWEWSAAHDGAGNSLELVNVALTNNNGRNWASSLAVGGTPGAANGTRQANSAPLISNVTHFPAVPQPTDPVFVSADIEDELSTGVTATLFYRIASNSPGQFITLPMFDDGLHGDGDAGDGRYGATIPAQSADVVVEFFVQSRDAGNFVRTYPMANDDGTEALPRLLYQVDDEVYTGDQPIYRFIMTSQESTQFQNINRNSNAQMNATLVVVRGSDVSVRYNVGVRVRGASSRTRNPPGLRINIPHDREFDGKTSFNLNAQYTWLQTLGAALFQQAGIAAPTATPVQVRLNSTNRATAAAQAGSYVRVEVVDGEWASDHLPDDDQGNVYTKRRPDNQLAYRGASTAPFYNPATDIEDYEGEGGDGWEKQTNSSENDWSDLNELLRVLNQVAPAPGVSYFDRVNSVLDVDQWTRYTALMVLMNSRETSISNGADDDYDIYRGVDDPRFILVPHDLDTIFNQGDTSTSPTAGIFQPIDTSFAGTSLAVLVPFFHDPQVLELYYKNLEELVDTIFSQAQLDALVDNVLGGWIDATTINNLKSFATARRNYVNSLLPNDLTATSNLTTSNGYLHTTNPATVAFNGIADFGVTKKVLVNGTPANLDPFTRTWTTQGTTASTQSVIAYGSTWKYLANGSDQGTAWRASAFNDAAWPSGPAQLGYGDGDEGTVVNCGSSAPNCNSNNFITTYFRRSFTVADPSAFSSLTIHVRRDDGVAIYINGTEVVRDNLGPGAGFDQGASAVANDDGNSPVEFINIPANLLTAGTNVISAEVHQQSRTSTDITFDLELLGAIPSPGTSIPLTPGVNTSLVQALGAGDVELEHETLQVWYDDGTTVPAGAIAANTTWTASNGPYVVSSNLAIPAGVTLTIQPGTSVYFEPGAGITVNGTLLANATQFSHIYMGPAPGSSAAWNGLTFTDSLTGNSLNYVDMRTADALGRSIGTTNSSLTLNHMAWTETTTTILDLTGSTFRVSNSSFPAIAGNANDEIIRGNGIRTGGNAIIEGSTFAAATGYNDVIKFFGGQRPGSILQVLNNVFNGGGDDAIDLYGADAHIEGNTFRGFHKNNASDSSSNAIAANADGGVASEATIARNNFYDNDHAALALDQSYLTFESNTVVGSTISAISFDETNRPVQPGLGATIESSIFTGNAADFSNVYNADPIEGTTQLLIDNSIVGGAYSNRGAGNLDSATNDPRIANAAGGDFTLLPGSAAKGAGRIGLDIGAMVPSGPTIVGEPLGTTSATSATLSIWGPGLTRYRYRVDNGGYFAEVPISTPIVLSNLAPGPHTIFVAARNSANVAQALSAPSSSSTWTVDPAVVSVVINEVLASNSTAFTVEGKHPDAIELYNRGDTPVNLSGWTLSDDPQEPTKYTLPEGTTIAEHGFLTILANEDDGSPGLHAGFNLSATGESITLYKTAASGGATVDSIAFGLQLTDRSIGRDVEGVWTLNVPTIGASNAVQQTGSQKSLRINEWVADEDRLFKDDRLELYNPDPLPVALGGLRLTDNLAGKPDKHEIAPLSFVAGAGFAVFIPDEQGSKGADHLNFNLDANYETVALLDASLNLIDQVLFMSQNPDISEGRSPDGQSPYTNISPPNIGFPNSTVLSVNELLANLRVTEIHYNPVGSADNDEFIELKNIGAAPLQLGCVQFVNGIEFEFPAMTLAPGQYVVVVADLAAFQAKYGTGINVAGQYSGRLDNSGENNELYVGGAFEAQIQDFSYDDAWYPSTDGNGPSLVLIDPTLPLDTWKLPASWRASGLLDGSPGSDDPLDGTPPQVAQVLVSSSNWTGPFLTQLDILTLGEGGYAIPAGAGQLDSLPWTGIDKITIVFSEPTNVTASSLALFGASVLQYQTVAAAFALDGARATWTLAQPIAADKLNLTLPGTLQDLAGNPLGSQFSFHFNVLPGDVNHDGAVNVADVAAALDSTFTSTSSAEYDPLRDIDGSGKITVQDAIKIRNAFGTTLPAGSPAGSAAAPAAIVARAATSSRAASDAAISALDAATLPRLRATRVHAAPPSLETSSTATDHSASGSATSTSRLRARRASRPVASATDAVFSQ